MKTNNSLWNGIPVTGKDLMHYKNLEIANCNNQQNVTLWTIAFLLGSCAKEIDFELMKNFSNVEIVNSYLKLGCELRVLPPENPIPRFCINFEHNENSCGKERIPVMTHFATYRNKECCLKGRGSCQTCSDSGISFADQLKSRYGHSMMAFFQFGHFANNEVKLYR